MSWLLASVCESISVLQSVIVVDGASGYGKSHLVGTCVAKVNAYATNVRDQRVIKVFTPENLSHTSGLDRLETVLFGREVTGRIPVIVIKQFVQLSAECKARLRRLLQHINEVEDLEMRRLVKVRNPVVIMTDGSDDSYNGASAMFLKQFTLVQVPEPTSIGKLNLTKQYLATHYCNLIKFLLYVIKILFIIIEIL